MTATSYDGDPGDDRDSSPAARGPVRVGRVISALLRGMPGPDLDDSSRAGWLAAKADLFDRIATAAATQALADEATAAARAARTALAGLTASITCTGTTSSTNGTSSASSMNGTTASTTRTTRATSGTTGIGGVL